MLFRSFVALCQQPTSLTASQVTANSATIEFVVPESQSLWQIKVSTSLLENITTDAAHVDTLVNTTQVALNGLTPNTFYYFYVRSICGANDTSAWSSANYFMTDCAAYNGRMFEQFEGARFPAHCWERFTGNLNGVQQGNRLVTTSNGWSQNNSSILGSQHAAISMDRSFLNYWLVSPEIALIDSAVLSFDLAISSEKSIHQAPFVSPNDRFMVMVSTDGGASWDVTNATIWSNGANGDYAFRQLNNQGNTFEIDLLAYSNQNIRVAFYAESGDIHFSQFYDLHLDNVRVNKIGRAHV